MALNSQSHRVNVKFSPRNIFTIRTTTMVFYVVIIYKYLSFACSNTFLFLFPYLVAAVVVAHFIRHSASKFSHSIISIKIFCHSIRCFYRCAFLLYYYFLFIIFFLYFTCTSAHHGLCEVYNSSM